MSRRMSCSLTIDAVRDRRKTVTRRDPATWVDLQVGDRLLLIEKGMGLARGERQVELCEVEIIDVRIEPLARMLERSYGIAECEAEGFPHLQRREFVEFWLRSHPHVRGSREQPVMVRRIEWVYL